MTLFINSQNEYPRHIGDLLLEHPDWKEGEELPEGWKAVVEVEYPEVGENETVDEKAPKLIDGVMTQVFEVRPFTAEELERIEAPKRAREKLLALGLTEFEIQALSQGLVR